jgi:IS605 OrfB family transposase
MAFEKLNPSEMVKKTNKKVGKYTRDRMLKACWTQLAQFTTYKVQETGKWVEFVNPHNTSKRCSKCDEINEKLGDKEIFKCSDLECDNVLDRDVNAAKNILWKAQNQIRVNSNGLGTSLTESSIASGMLIV